MGYGLDMSALMETFTEAVDAGAAADTYSIADIPDTTSYGGWVFDNIYVGTLDDYGWPYEWEVYVKVATDDSWVNLDGDTAEMGVLIIQLDGDDYDSNDGNDFRTYYPFFEGDEPSFSNAADAGLTFTAKVDLNSDAYDGLRDKFGYASSPFDTLFKKYVVEVAAGIVLSTGESVHTFKNIKSTEIDDETFDALEGEEAAQTVTVSTTYAYES